MTDTAPIEQIAPPTMFGALLTETNGQAVLHTTPSAYLKLVKALADDGFAVAVDVCGVDYLTYTDRAVPAGVTAERFEVVVNMLDMTKMRRIRVRCQVPESNPSVASLYSMFPGVEAMERECFDLMGIAFENHPDLTRILMPESWVGHPLRKDYDIGKIPVQFKNDGAKARS